MDLRIKALGLVAGATLGMATSSGGAEVARITNGEWPPFTSKDFQYSGVLSRIVADAFALEGVTVEYGYFPWKRAYVYAKDGEWDGSVGWAPTAEHNQDLYMSDPVIFVDKGLFHLKNTAFSWSAIGDLSKWRVGGTAGYSYGDEWDKAVKAGSLKIEEVTADEQNIKKLAAQRIDVIAMEIDVALFLIQSQLTPAQAAQITYSPKLIMQTPICVGLSKKNPKNKTLIERFNAGLKKLKANGAYLKYMEESRKGLYAKKG